MCRSLSITILSMVVPKARVNFPGLISRPGPMFEEHHPLGILLQICHQGYILFITGMKLAIYQHLICGVTPKRYPMFGGWRTAFTIGYGLPLQDILYESDGKRFLNVTYSSPMVELVIDTLIVKVVLPEGSGDISVAAPFPVEQWRETKISHLDIDGRPVVVLKKINVVPEHNQYFQVYYQFSKLSMLREPLMLISGFFFFFVACIVYMRADISISKSSASYLAKQQWEEVQAVVQQVQNIISRCLAIHDKLEASLHDLYRTGDIQTCKAARKAADGLLKELSRESKPLLTTLQSSPSAAQYPRLTCL